MLKAADAWPGLAPRFSGFTVPDEVTRFCADEGITGALELALGLAREQFEGSVSAGFGVIPGLSDGDRWIAVNVRVPKTHAIGAVADAYDAYTRRWVAAASPDMREKIRLSFNRV